MAKQQTLPENDKPVTVDEAMTLLRRALIFGEHRWHCTFAKHDRLRGCSCGRHELLDEYDAIERRLRNIPAAR